MAWLVCAKLAACGLALPFLTVYIFRDPSSLRHFSSLMPESVRYFNAASPDIIDKIQEVSYDSNLFATPSNPADGRPADKCCICLQSFDAGLPLKRTTCGHFFHANCLQEWLKHARSCPVCRGDLQKAYSQKVDDVLSVSSVACISNADLLAV